MGKSPSNLDRFAQDATMRSSNDATSAAISLAARQVADISKSKAIIAFTTGDHISSHLLPHTFTPTFSYPLIPSLTQPLTSFHIPSHISTDTPSHTLSYTPPQD